jgi:hypothetical protein
MKKAFTVGTVIVSFVLALAFAVLAGRGYDDGSSFSGI